MERSKGKLTIILLSILMCGLLGLAGCKDAEKESAIAEAAAAKTELAKVKADLAGVIGERDGLKLELATVIEARDKLQVAVDQAKTIQEQLAGLTKERDAATAKATEAQGIIKRLQSQLDEQIRKVVGLESENTQLQEMIAELKKNFGNMVENPSIP